MMLSAAKPGKKGLTSLFIDGEFAVKVDTAVFEASDIKIGSGITDEELRALIQKSDECRAYEKGLYLLGYRAHSQKELAEKLSRVFPREAACKAVSRLAELGLADDEAYAYSRASYLFNRKGFSPYRVKFDLRQKGIDESTAEKVVGQTCPDTVEKIKEIIKKKYPAFASDEKVKRRAANALRRLGYGWEDIIGAFDALESGDDFY
ncbi:MAG TPA: hypothetical protein DIV41_05605 [Ruminococcaceae bacterium]|jgi:regulatory protein|nr:hypothetical protein [Oscillospiraceae bacterium]